MTSRRSPWSSRRDSSPGPQRHCPLRREKRAETIEGRVAVLVVLCGVSTCSWLGADDLSNGHCHERQIVVLWCAVFGETCTSGANSRATVTGSFRQGGG